MFKRVMSWSAGSLMWLAAAAAPEAMETELEGTAKDKSGGVVVGARIMVMTPQRAVVATTTTDKAGKYKIKLPDGEYLVVAQLPPLLEKQTSVTLSGTKVTLDLVLEIGAFRQDVTVTASPGEIGDLSKSTQPVNIISEDQILIRAKSVVAQAVEGEVGVTLQRTSPGMAGIFVRGLTGNKVNIFVDGVRYSNGAQRGGVNTFLDLIDPTTLSGVEVLRGTASAQYGSDALGGSIQFLSRPTPLSSTGRPEFDATFTTGVESGHVGGFGAATFAYAQPKFGLSGGFSGRQTGDYNPGGADDSHAAVKRFLGVDSHVLYPNRMPDTGFNQAAGQLRANWLVAPDVMIVANYLHTRQDGANRWDQILGGDGNLISELNDLQLDLAYVRIEKMGLGWFDRGSATYSFNTQREERVNQGGQGNPNAAINHDPERTNVHGVQFNASRKASARQNFVIGGDAYFEQINAVSFAEDPNTHVKTTIRPRVPDQATYRQAGVFAETDFKLRPDLILTGALRGGFSAYAAHASDAPIAGGKPLWPDDSLSTKSATFRAGAAYSPKTEWTITSAVSTGFRAPHMTDLGTLGLTGSGFEVAAPDVAGLNGFVGTTADSAAKSTGRPVAQVGPESNINVDVGVRYRSSKVRAAAGYFNNTIDGNIQKQALILPAGSVGTVIGGETITSQTPDGAVFVAASTTPVLVRANFDHARIWGVEIEGEIIATRSVTLGGMYLLMRARDTGTNLPPNIEGGTPAPGGTFRVHLAREGQHWWLEPYVNFAAKQSHLSSLDLGDRRTGAARTRSQIQNFFRRGATVRGWVTAGADGTFGNADDILTATNETLAQVQERVLPGVTSSTASVPMITAIPGYVVFGVRFGITHGAHAFVINAENLGDKNYRGISWGMDAPGRGITARYSYRFKGL